MDQRHVDAFFADGSLRLTSFERCHRHADEQRLDAEEGSCRVLVTSRQTGMALSFHELVANHPAYMLCTTLWHNKDLMKSFNCESFLRIHDPAAFGTRVAKHVPAFLEGGEGPCIYQHLRLIEAEIDDTERTQNASESDGRQNRAATAIAGARHYQYFLKHKSFSHQAEYRLLWFFANDSERREYLDIKVPEARELCSAPESFEFDADDPVWSPPSTR